MGSDIPITHFLESYCLRIKLIKNKKESLLLTCCVVAVI